MAGGYQALMLESAVEAGVKWIIPNEYSLDGMNNAMVDKAPLTWPKREARQLVEKVSAEHGGKAKWIGVATNPWVPFGIQTGSFGINIYKKTATLYSDAGSFNVSTLDQVGRGIAALLSLPVTNEQNPRASLTHYGNNFVYISSAFITQQQLFEAMQRATGTTQADWEISHSTCAERLRVAQEKFAAGDVFGGADGIFSVYMAEGNYEDKAKADREVLGLQELSNLDGIAKEAVESPPPVAFK